MLEMIFITALNMSITASWLVIAVILLRFVFKKMPKWIMGILWGFVALRLVMPFSIESKLSFVPSAETFPYENINSHTPYIESGISSLNNALNPALTEALRPNPAASADPIQIIIPIAGVIWLIGIIVMLSYTLFSFIHIKKSVREAAHLRDSIWICDNIQTPFILGVIKPKIYLPSMMNDDDVKHVIAHETAHLKRRDHIIKPLGFLLLSVYWFNPILWLAYILMCRDIELACDERVLKSADESIKKAYSNALINCSAPKKAISACPVAFGEVGIKTRIKNILNYKKPAMWVIIIAIVSCILCAFFFLTNPINDDIKSPIGNTYTVIEGETGPSLSILYDNSVIKRYSFTNDDKNTIMLISYDYGALENSELPSNGASSSKINLIQGNIEDIDFNFETKLRFKKYQVRSVWSISTERSEEIYNLFVLKNGEYFITRSYKNKATGGADLISIERLVLTSESIAIIGGADGPAEIITSED